MGVAGAKLTTITAEELGDTAIEQGQFVLSGADGSQLDHGKYMVISKRTANGICIRTSGIAARVKWLWVP